MTKTEARPAIAAVNELFGRSPDGLRELVRAVVQDLRGGVLMEATTQDDAVLLDLSPSDLMQLRVEFS